ncbi:ciliary microtubule inner protein 6-like isoform X2 [Babylonia areolata]|uniref:ciliary microtubule inner protein 6-like isoform X2 n=1 Tax=Babylonia areolata TaxID=304850 RepID=UPI003FD53483
MTVYMPPIARKKRVEERYNPDTFRVISGDAEETHTRYTPRPYRASFEPPTPDERLFPDINCGRTRVLPRPTTDFRANNPHPKSCSFIRTDVRLLNEPVCTVHTRETHPQQNKWWPARANEGTLEKGDHTLDTIYRNDFLYTKDLAPQPTFRHTANPNTTASRGIAPVNFMKEKDGQQGFYKEDLSFEHQYDSRSNPNYPIRSKRHGAFVYSKLSSEAKQKFTEYHKELNEESQTAFNQSSDGMENCQEPVPSLTQSARPTAKVPSPERMMPTASSPIECCHEKSRLLQ